MSSNSYQIDPRPADLGGGWRLRLLESGWVFPLSECAAAESAEEAAIISIRCIRFQPLLDQNCQTTRKIFHFMTKSARCKTPENAYAISNY